LIFSNNTWVTCDAVRKTQRHETRGVSGVRGVQAKKHGETDIGSETHQDGAQVRHVAEKAKDIHDRRISSKVRSGLIVGGDALTLESRPRARLCDCTWERR
jgi:hypothetical protein